MDATVVEQSALSSSQLVENFLTCTLVCMANALYDVDYCYKIIIRSSRIMGLKMNTVLPAPIEFQKIFHKYKEKYTNGQKVATYAEYLVRNMRIAQDIWLDTFPLQNSRALTDRCIDSLKRRIENDGNIAGWPMTDAVYIWPWLHIIAIHLDFNAGLDEKISFIDFVPNIIACHNCKNHYRQHRDQLVKALQVTTCANALLALHTYVNSTRKHVDLDDDDDEDNNEDDAANDQSKQHVKTIFKYNINLVNLFFYMRYRREYITLLATNYNKTII